MQQDYAASLENSASSAKDAEKATEGYLSPLDEINKLEKKDTSKDSGSGVSPKDMFKDVEVEPLQFDSWGEAFNSLLDYLLNNGVPALRKALSSMADTLNTFSQNLYEAFTFPGVKEKVQQLGQEVAQALNDFVSWIDWKSIGGSFGSRAESGPSVHGKPDLYVQLAGLRRLHCYGGESGDCGDRLEQRGKTALGEV